MNMRSLRFLRLNWKPASALLACALIVVGWRIWLKFRVPETLSNPRGSYTETRPLLATVPTPDGVRNSLLTGDFSVVKRFANISEECRTSFLSSFASSSSAKLSSADIADPGAPFQSSDALVAGLPFRRLVFAGERRDECFIYYLHGGKMYPRWCVAIIDKLHGKPVWVGMRVGSIPAQTLDELQAQIRAGVFQDDVGPVC